MDEVSSAVEMVNFRQKKQRLAIIASYQPSKEPSRLARWEVSFDNKTWLQGSSPYVM